MINIKSYSVSKTDGNQQTTVTNIYNSGGSGATVIPDEVPYADVAGKLKTPHKIWGHDFDGTQDVSGDLTTTNITATNQLKSTGSTSLSTLTVSGATTLNGTTTANSLTVSGATTLNGTTTTKNLTTNGTATVNGTATTQSLSVTNDATVGGNMNVTKTVTANSMSTNTLTVSTKATIKEIASEIINNVGKITTKDLDVTGTATFWELVINKIRAVGGAVILSPADGFKTIYVKEETDYFRLCWKRTDGDGEGDVSANMWQVGDYAMCRSCRALVNNSKYNTYYWAKVINRGATTVGNESYNYIDISKTVKDPTCTLNPSVGDEIVMLGSEKAGRGGALYLSATSGLDTALKPPFIAQYDNINPSDKGWDLATYRKTYLSNNGNEFIGNFKVSSDKSIEDYIKDEVDKQPTPEAPTIYQYTRYCVDPNDSYIYSNDSDSMKYVGMYVGTSTVPPTNKAEYTWVKKGEKGDTPKLYQWTRYCITLGDNYMQKDDSDDMKLVGIYIGTESTAPTDKSKYSWVKKGQDGVSPEAPKIYSYTRYCVDPNDSNMYATDSDSMNYVGIYVGTSTVPPSMKSAYSWVKKGKDGETPDITIPEQTEVYVPYLVIGKAKLDTHSAQYPNDNRTGYDYAINATVEIYKTKGTNIAKVTDVTSSVYTISAEYSSTKPISATPSIINKTQLTLSFTDYQTVNTFATINLVVKKKVGSAWVEIGKFSIPVTTENKVIFDVNTKLNKITATVTGEGGLMTQVEQNASAITSQATRLDGLDSKTSEIKQTADSVSASVTDLSTGLERCGIHLNAKDDESKITLNADTTTMTGDFYLNGTFGNSTKTLEPNAYEGNSLEVVNGLYTTLTTNNANAMPKKDTLKSITVKKAIDGNGNLASGYQYQTVILPMIKDISIDEQFANESKTLYYRQKGYNKAGVSLSIYTQQVASISNWYNYNWTSRDIQINYDKWLRAATLVSADALCFYTPNEHNNMNSKTAKGHKFGNISLTNSSTNYFNSLGGRHGRFSVNGSICRFILVGAGQSLHLRSSIETISGEQCLVWNVINSEEYEPSRILFAQNINGTDLPIYDPKTPNQTSQTPFPFASYTSSLNGISNESGMLDIVCLPKNIALKSENANDTVSKVYPKLRILMYVGTDDYGRPNWWANIQANTKKTTDTYDNWVNCNGTQKV